MRSERVRSVLERASLGELRKGAEEGLRVVLEVCGESMGNVDESLQNGDESLQNGDESLQDIHNPNESSPSSHQLTSSHSLAEPVHSIQAYFEKLPPEDIATDPILSSLVASLPTLLRFLKTPSVSFIVLCYE